MRTDPIQGEILHVYDGIEEADNELPRWWLATLFGAIIVGVGYWVYYETFHVGASPMEAYAIAKLEALEKAGPVSEEDLVALSTDDQMVSAGKNIFSVQCSECHKPDASGDKGPNLTYRFWLHGGSALNIYGTVSKGVDGKGMKAWGPALGSAKVKQLTAYLLTIRNSERPGKPLEGEEYVPVVEDVVEDIVQEPADMDAPVAPQ